MGGGKSRHTDHHPGGAVADAAAFRCVRSGSWAPTPGVASAQRASCGASMSGPRAGGRVRCALEGVGATASRHRQVPADRDGIAHPLVRVAHRSAGMAAVGRRAAVRAPVPRVVRASWPTPPPRRRPGALVGKPRRVVGKPRRVVGKPRRVAGAAGGTARFREGREGPGIGTVRAGLRLPREKIGETPLLTGQRTLGEILPYRRPVSLAQRPLRRRRRPGGRPLGHGSHASSEVVRSTAGARTRPSRRGISASIRRNVASACPTIWSML